MRYSHIPQRLSCCLAPVSQYVQSSHYSILLGSSLSSQAAVPNSKSVVVDIHFRLYRPRPPLMSTGCCPCSRCSLAGLIFRVRLCSRRWRFASLLSVRRLPSASWCVDASRVCMLTESGMDPSRNLQLEMMGIEIVVECMRKTS